MIVVYVLVGWVAVSFLLGAAWSFACYRLRSDVKRPEPVRYEGSE